VTSNQFGGLAAGVQGINTIYGTAVFGLSLTGGWGVVGASNGPVESSVVPVGVLAISTTGYGSQSVATTTSGAGAAATNTAAGGAALVANATATSGAGMGIYANCASPQRIGLAAYGSGGGPAAYFGGGVYVNGPLMVSGAKNAVVRDSSGSLRRMYSMESPDSWFEDAGSGRLTNGATRVELPADFAQFVHTDDYHIFLTPRGASEGPLRRQQRRDRLQRPRAARRHERHRFQLADHGKTQGHCRAEARARRRPAAAGPAGSPRRLARAVRDRVEPGTGLGSLRGACSLALWERVGVRAPPRRSREKKSLRRPSPGPAECRRSRRGGRAGLRLAARRHGIMLRRWWRAPGSDPIRELLLR
jgi:hypothetical protein